MAKVLSSIVGVTLLSVTPSFAADHGPGDLENAFKAAFPQSSILVDYPRAYSGGASENEAIKVHLKLKPDKLVALGSNRYALIVLEEDDQGSHAERGALSVAYLQKAPTGWKVDHVWRELAWTGNTGRPAKSFLSTKHNDAPLVFFKDEYVSGGIYSLTGYELVLEASGPKMGGSFPSGGLRGQDACSVCFHYAYVGYVHPPHHPYDLFSISYRGWTSAKGQVQRLRWFSSRTDYKISPSGLVAVTPVTLPGQ